MESRDKHVMEERGCEDEDDGGYGHTLILSHGPNSSGVMATRQLICK